MGHMSSSTTSLVATCKAAPLCPVLPAWAGLTWDMLKVCRALSVLEGMVQVEACMAQRSDKHGREKGNVGLALCGIMESRRGSKCPSMHGM